MRRALVVVLSVAACGGEEQSQAPPWATGGQSPAAAARPAAPAGAAAPAPSGAGTSQVPVAGQATPGSDPGRAALLADLRKRPWKNEDFIENEGNRDPFKAFLSNFSGERAAEQPQYRIFMPKYSLDEVKLAAITGPRGGAGRTSRWAREKDDPECDVRPCATFVDPNGVGTTVSRNFHISKSDARVVRIDPEKGQVFVEIKEDLGNGKSRMVERVLEMHPTAEGQTP